MKLLSFLIFAVVFAASGLFQAVTNGFKYGNQQRAVPEVQVSVIEMQQANDLFRSFVNNKEIVFSFPVDGCYARATLMAKMAEDQKIQMGKIFAEGLLVARTSSDAFPIARWGWHVAPIAHVKQSDGTTRLMIFDPSLFDRPVTEEEWTQKMQYDQDILKPRLDKVYYGSRFQTNPSSHETIQTRWGSNLRKSSELMNFFKGLMDQYETKIKEIEMERANWDLFHRNRPQLTPGGVQ